VEWFIALDIDIDEAIARINAEGTSGGTCEFVETEYIVGGIFGDASNAQGTWEIRKVFIVGLIVGRVRKPVLTYQKYLAGQVGHEHRVWRCARCRGGGRVLLHLRTALFSW
jgi:hypothetical protein